jgi:hypothetical protein
VTFSENSQLRTAYELRPKQHTGGVRILGGFVLWWRWATVAGSGHHLLSLPIPHAHLLQRRRVAQGRPVHGVHREEVIVRIIVELRQHQHLFLRDPRRRRQDPSSFKTLAFTATGMPSQETEGR